MSTGAVTSALNSTILGNATAAGSTAPPIKQLGQEDFLKLLVTQMQHQDPLKPMENQEFIAQLAQFSQLQASVDQTKLLQQSLEQQATSMQLGMTAMIGHRMKIGGGLAAWDGSTPVNAQYALDADAAAVTVRIVDANGQTIKTLNEGARPTGVNSIVWDGTTDEGTSALPGIYWIDVVAKDTHNVPVTSTVSSFATITGVRTAEGQRLFLVGDNVVDPKNVVEFY